MMVNWLVSFPKFHLQGAHKFQQIIEFPKLGLSSVNKQRKVMPGVIQNAMFQTLVLNSDVVET